jgi:glucokinase
LSASTGHIAVPDAPAPCYCGLPSCWEQAASRTALEAMTGPDPTSAADAARRGDAQAVRIFEHYGLQVTAGLATLLTLFRPDRVVLGGSAARYLDLYAPALQTGIARNTPYQWTPPLLPARLGDLAGAVGAAVLARTGDQRDNGDPRTSSNSAMTVRRQATTARIRTTPRS